MFCNLNESEGIGGSFNDFIVVILLTLLLTLYKSKVAQYGQ